MSLKRLVGGYYGTRNADFFPKLFIERACAGANYFVDITAGTGQFPYRLATMHQKPVLLFERCPYVGYLLRAVFEGGHKSLTLKKGKLERDKAFGYLSKRTDLVGVVFSEKLASHLDYLAAWALHQQDEALSHSIGRALNSIFTFRSLNWSKTTAKGRLSTSITIEEVEVKIMATMTDINEYYRAIPPKVSRASTVFIGDSVKLVPKMGAAGGLKDAIVYADPAWPWGDGNASNDNPYRFAYEELSSVIEQKPLKLPEIWHREDADRIKSEVLGWVRESFKAGARQFIACTQDTNFPHPNAVRQWFVDAGFKVPHTMKMHDRPTSADREYLNYWFFLEP